MGWEMLPPKYDDDLGDWQDDPQGRALMTEALDDIAKLCARIDELEAERDVLKAENKVLLEVIETDKSIMTDLMNMENERDTLKAENKRLRKALKKIAGSGPVPNAYEAWSWCYDIAKAALAANEGDGK